MAREACGSSDRQVQSVASRQPLDRDAAADLRAELHLPLQDEDERFRLGGRQCEVDERSLSDRGEERLEPLAAVRLRQRPEEVVIFPDPGPRGLDARCEGLRVEDVRTPIDQVVPLAEGRQQRPQPDAERGGDSRELFERQWRLAGFDVRELCGRHPDAGRQRAQAQPLFEARPPNERRGAGGVVLQVGKVDGHRWLFMIQHIGWSLIETSRTNRPAIC